MAAAEKTGTEVVIIKDSSGYRRTAPRHSIAVVAAFFNSKLVLLCFSRDPTTARKNPEKSITTGRHYYTEMLAGRTPSVDGRRLFLFLRLGGCVAKFNYKVY